MIVVNGNDIKFYRMPFLDKLSKSVNMHCSWNAFYSIMSECVVCKLCNCIILIAVGLGNEM